MMLSFEMLCKRRVVDWKDICGRKLCMCFYGLHLANNNVVFWLNIFDNKEDVLIFSLKDNLSNQKLCLWAFSHACSIKVIAKPNKIPTMSLHCFSNYSARQTVTVYLHFTCATWACKFVSYEMLIKKLKLFHIFDIFRLVIHVVWPQCLFVYVHLTDDFVANISCIN